MEIYVTLEDFSKNFEHYFDRVLNSDERVVVQNEVGDTLVVLVHPRVIDVIEKMAKSMKVNVVSE